MSTAYDIQSKKPIYNGFQYDSKLEANWAVFFNELGIRYTPHPYEFKTGFSTANTEIVYTPDFYLNDYNVYCEAKPNSNYLNNPEIQRKISAAMTNNATPVGHGLMMLGLMTGYSNENKKMSIYGQYYRWFGCEILKSKWVIGEWDNGIEIRFTEPDYDNDLSYASFPRFSSDPSPDITVRYDLPYGSEAIYKAFFSAIYAEQNGCFN